MRIAGSVGEPQGRRNGWSKTIGDYVEFIWRGSPDYVTSVHSQLRAGTAVEVETEIDGSHGTCRARFAGSTEPGGEEQLRVEIRRSRNDVQKSIFEAGPDGFSHDVPADELRQIKKLLDSNSDEDFTAWLPTSTPDGISLYELALAGVEFRVVSQPVITQVTTAGGGFEWPNLDGLSGVVCSQATMQGLLRDAPRFNIPTAPGTAPSGFTYGWKLHKPTYEQSSDGHTSEVLEFEFGLWPNFLNTFA